MDAQEIYFHPSLAIRIGMTEVRSGLCELARQRMAEIEADELPDDADEDLELFREELSECTSMGQLLVECSPTDAEASMADVELECGESIDFQVGEYRLRVSHPLYLEYSTDIVIEEGEETRQNVALKRLPESDASWMSPVAYSSAAAGTAMLVTGLVVDSRAPSRQDQILEASADGDTQRVDELETLAIRRRKQSGILVGAGATLMASGTALFVINRRKNSGEESESRARFIPSTSGITFRASW